MPLFGLVRLWVTGLLAVALWVGVVLLVRNWADRLPDPRPPRPAATADVPPPPEPSPPSFGERLSAWRPALDTTTALLAGAVLLSLLGIGGGRLFWRLVLPKRPDDPKHERAGTARKVRRPDGTELQVEVMGRPDGPTVVLTHGWGATTTEWYHLRGRLGHRYRVVAWDLPGLGLSKGPDDRNFRLDKMAADLRAVLDDVGGGPFVLVGHSIGGMITLQFAKQYPDELGRRVAGLVLVHTTHTNPLRTTQYSGLYTALQKPVVEPLCYLMIALSPIVWLMTTLGYLNGSVHGSNYRQLFSWTGTWGQLEFATRYVLGVWPATYARGTLGMFRFHATDALPRITVPTLVVAADRDKMTKPDASEQMRAAIPNAELVTLSPAGHMGLIQRPEEFGRAVEGFVGRCLEVPAVERERVTV
jgi:pimeloyl-ACP methyl ester carboxylesterase